MKSRPDSFYAKMSEKEQEDLFRKVRGLSLVQGVALAKEAYGLKVSKSALSRFKLKMEEDFSRNLREVLASSALRAKETAEAAPIAPGVIADSLRAMGARLIELGDEERGFNYLKNAANMDRISAELSRQKLDREKFEAQEKREAAARGTLENNKLSPAEVTARMKEIYGIA